MRRAILFFLSAVLAAQQQPASQVEKKGSISGVVVNAITKEPVRRAEVAASTFGNRQGPPGGFAGPGQQQSMPGQQRVSTDAEGKFIISDLSAGSYNLNARRSGLLDARYGAKGRTSPGAQVTVSSGQDVTGIRIEMMPQSVIAGRVIDDDGEALQGVMVQLQQAQSASTPTGRAMRAIGMSNGRTDDRGEFRLTNISPGTYTLQIIPNLPSGNPAANETPMGYVSMYYPGVYDPSQAEKIKVAAGAELSGFQFRLQKTRVYKISGMVLDIDGQPPRGYFVSAVPKGALGFGGMSPQFTRTKEGGFELRNIASGSYNLMVRVQGGQRTNFYREPLEVGSQDVQNLTIRIPQPVQLTGQVLASQNSGTQPPDLARIRVNLIDVEGGGIGFGGSGGQSQTNADGTFTISNVVPGKYRINVSMPQDAGYLESVKFGEQDVTGQEFTVSAGGAPIRVTLGSNGGSVTGMIAADGNPAPGATIVLLPVRKELREQPFLRTTSTDQNASFSIKNIAPGDYLLLGFEDYDASVLDDENQFAIVERKAKKISIGKGASESATLELIRSTT